MRTHIARRTRLVALTLSLAGVAATAACQTQAPPAAPTPPAVSATPGPTATTASSFVPLLGTETADLITASGTNREPEPVTPDLTAQLATLPDGSGSELAAAVYNASADGLANLRLTVTLPPGARIQGDVTSPPGVAVTAEGRTVEWRLNSVPRGTAAGPFTVRFEGPAQPVAVAAHWDGGEASATPAAALPRSFEAGTVTVASAAEASADPSLLAFTMDPAGVGRRLQLSPAPGETPPMEPTPEATSVAPQSSSQMSGVPMTWLTAVDVTAPGAASGDEPEAWLRLPLSEPALPGLALAVRYRPEGAQTWLPAGVYGSVAPDAFHALVPVRGSGTYAVGLPESVHRLGGYQGDINRLNFIYTIMRRSAGKGVAAAIPEAAEVQDLVTDPALNFFLSSLGRGYIRMRLGFDAAGSELTFACGIGGCLVTSDGPAPHRLGCPLTDGQCTELPAAGGLSCNSRGFTAFICLPEPAGSHGIPDLPAPDACRRPCIVDTSGKVLVDATGRRPATSPPEAMDRGLIWLGGRPVEVAVTYGLDQSFDTQ